jgi:uncharacterized protein
MGVAPNVRLRIDAHLSGVEETDHVRVLYAAESGSRAWGFPSADSDYDVRFIYIHPQPWYLSIESDTRRDIIERPLVEEIDLSGWDIRKALGLFARSNPPLMEWLDSSVVYSDRLGFAERLRRLLPDYFYPVAAVYHYLQMARGNFRAYLQGDRVRAKKYFYVLRPVLAARWVEQGRGPVPMRFVTLLQTVGDYPKLWDEVVALLARKLEGAELDAGPRWPAIHEFVTEELGRLGAVAGSQPKVRGSIEALDELFRDCLREAWV